MDQLDERVWNTLDQDDDSFEALTAPLVGLRGKRIRIGDDKTMPHQGMVYDKAADYSDDQEDWLRSKRSQDEFADLTLPYLVGSEVSKMEVKRTDDRIRPIDGRAADLCDDQAEEPINPGQPLVRIRNDDQEQDDKCTEENDRIEKEDDWKSNEAFEVLTLSFVDYGRVPTQTPGKILSDQVPDNDQERMVREHIAPDQTKETSLEDKLLGTTTTSSTGAPPTKIYDDDRQFEDRNDGAVQDDQEDSPIIYSAGRGIDDPGNKDEERIRNFHENLKNENTSTPEPSVGRKPQLSVGDDQVAQDDRNMMIKCSFKKGGICHLHGLGAKLRWKPVPLKT